MAKFGLIGLGETQSNKTRYINVLVINLRKLLSYDSVRKMKRNKIV